MKRTADQAGLPDSSHRLRLTVMVPPDKVTDNRAMSFFVDCDTTFTVDNVKWTLLTQIYSTTGKAARISSFQLQQEGQHLPYTQQITCLKSLSPLQLVRTALDGDQQNIRSLPVVTPIYSYSHVFSAMQRSQIALSCSAKTFDHVMCSFDARA